MARLEDAELSEEHVWLRGDIRHASITIGLAGRGEAEPFVKASYKLYGLHPNAMARNLGQAWRQASEQFSDWFDQAGNLKPDLPKKLQVPIPEAEQYPRLPDAEDSDDERGCVRRAGLGVDSSPWDCPPFLAQQLRDCSRMKRFRPETTLIQAALRDRCTSGRDRFYLCELQK